MSFSMISGIKSIVLVSTAAVMLSACSQKIDGSSSDTFTASVNSITKNMSSDQLQKFRENLRKASAYSVYMSIPEEKRAEAAINMLMSPAGGTARAISLLHGKTQSEISDLAKEWDQFVYKKRVADAQDDLDQKKRARQLLEAVREAAPLVNIVSIHVAPNEAGMMKVTATIENRSKIALSSVSFSNFGETVLKSSLLPGATATTTITTEIHQSQFTDELMKKANAFVGDKVSYLFPRIDDWPGMENTLRNNLFGMILHLDTLISMSDDSITRAENALTKAKSEKP